MGRFPRLLEVRPNERASRSRAIHATPRTSSASSPLATLRRFAQPSAPVERCELCSLELPGEHQHLVEPRERRLLCACDACALLFCDDGSTKYRRVPRDSWFLSDFRLPEAQWGQLNIPIGLAFFFRSSVADQILAIYPSPAGPTESTLGLDAWETLCQSNPALRTMASDTQALLVHRVHNACEHYLAPIDVCYQLVGLIRARWQGFTGGSEAWQAIDDFFAQLRRRARQRPQAPEEAKP